MKNSKKYNKKKTIKVILGRRYGIPNLKIKDTENNSYKKMECVWVQNSNITKNAIMVSSSDIYDSNNKLIVKTGQEMSLELIEKLKEHGIISIYVYEEDIDLLEILNLKELEPVISKETQDKSIEIIEDLFIHKELKPQKYITEIVDQLIDEIYEAGEIATPTRKLRDYDNYTYQHSVNVCILGIILGKKLGLNRSELKVLGYGLILHDYGKTTIPIEIINKPTKLTKEEFEIIKTHPKNGLELLLKQYELNPISQGVILFHHEKYNGAGYPIGLTKLKIPLCAQIASIVDVYDAITSQRTYNKKKTPFTALWTMIKDADIHFNRNLLRKFIKCFKAETI